MRINGRPLLTCELLVENAVELFNTFVFTVEPLTIAPVIRDLVVDLERAYQSVHIAKPFIIAPAPPHPEGDEYRISPKVLDRYVEATRCVNCFSCATACVTQKNYLGPNAMLANVVRMMDGVEQPRLAHSCVPKRSISPISLPWPKRAISDNRPRKSNPPPLVMI
jgi:succinate dehydrogenase / fumarate reductase iron-sulfur subunit